MLEYPNINPVALDLGFAQVYWYGLMYIFGLGAGYFLLRHLIVTGKTQIRQENAEDAIIYTALGLLLGGRLGYFLFYNFSVLLANPLHIFNLSTGGMSFHGAFIGIFIAAWIFSKRYKIALGELANILAITAPIGIFCGRIGNFINQELWGRPTDSALGMVFPLDPLALARHPSQLYEAFGEGLLILAIVLWYNKKRRPNWSTGALFFMLYGSVRFIIEFFREPDIQIGLEALGLTRGQYFCLPMIIIGLLVFIWANKKTAH